MGYEYNNDPSGIKYTKLPEAGYEKLNYKPQYSGNDFEHADEDGIETFVNAVEIDWNGAQIGES